MKIIVLFLVGYFAVCCHAQCSQGSTTNWTEQPIDTDPNSLDDPDGTPLGFAQLEIPGTDNMNTQRPCITVNFPQEANDKSRYLTVLVESNAGRICIEVDGSGEGQTCGQGRVPALCEPVGSQTVRFDLTCDSSCPQEFYFLYYRVQADYREVDDEFFCNNINITYPSDLSVVPTQPIEVDIMTRPAGGAAAISSLFLQALLLVSLLAMLLM